MGREEGEMEIITTSHIDQQHADSEYFPQAHTADGRYAWHHGIPGYVVLDAAAAGIAPDEDRTTRTIYLQYPPADVPPAVVAEARQFSREVDALQDDRHRERLARELQQDNEHAAAAKATQMTAFAQARQTGQPVFLRSASCDGSALDECSTDYLYAMPDGRTNRVHQH